MRTWWTVPRGGAVLLLVALAVLGLRAGEGFHPGARGESLPGGSGLWVGLPLAVGLLALIVARNGLRSLPSAVVLAALCVGVLVVIEQWTLRNAIEPRPPRSRDSTPPRDAELPADGLMYASVASLALLAVLLFAYLLYRRLRSRELLEEGGPLRLAREGAVPDEEEDAPEPEAADAPRRARRVPRGGAPTEDHRGAVIAAYAALEAVLSRAAGVTRRPAETPDELLRRARRGGLPTADAEQLGALYAAARYSTHPVTGADSERAGRALRRQRETWRAG
ncbi:DUF4129 domain-containing protein [Streptomyces sp. NPDC051940]|uniref:DUF4129 domain-containing protein n=1 Tax=Streptomyces sp. NPDC051940 TaxID=3155675 RepID=UPI003432C144